MRKNKFIIIKKFLLTIFLVILIMNITTIKSLAIKTFDEVANEYGMSASELEKNIESGVTPNDLNKIEQETVNIESMGSKAVKVGIMAVVIVAVVIIINLIPTIIAVKRKHPQKVAIILVDVFLGWTLIGWIACLVWACITPENKDNVLNNKYEDLARLQKLKENGTITEAEFEIEKIKLLK